VSDDFNDHGVSCPLCKGPSRKVISFALPMRICADTECSCAFGFFSRVIFWLEEHVVSWDGSLFVYRGSYVQGLRMWITHGWGHE
jgi:hypothetical protein